MSFSSENGYTPRTFQQIMDGFMAGVNAQFGTSFTSDSFVGTNWYKYLYAPAQMVQQIEVKASEIFQKVQQYIPEANQKIERPSVTFAGLVDAFSAQSYIASIKPPAEIDAGKAFICVDVSDSDAGVRAEGSFEITSFGNLVSGTDDSVGVGATTFTAQAGSVTPGGTTFQAASSNEATATSLAAQINAHATAGALVTALAVGATVKIRAIARSTSGNSIALAYTDNDTNVGATKSGTHLAGGIEPSDAWAGKKLQICGLVRDFVAAGIVSEGDQVETLTISNGQSFDFKFTLPERIPVLLRATMHTSENNLLAIPDDETLRQRIFDQVNARYRLGWDFEPQRYFNLSDVPWASDCILEWSDDNGSNWHSEVSENSYIDIFDFALEDIEVLIDP